MPAVWFALMLASPSSGSAQGPWTQGKGNGYGQIIYNTIPTYSSVYGGDGFGTRSLQREQSESMVAAYVEYGVTNTLTVGANVRFTWVQTGAARPAVIEPSYPAGRLSAFGNVGLFGKVPILDRAIKVAAIAQIDLPTGQRDILTGLSTGANAFTFQPKVSVGGSTRKVFGFGYAGYGYRTNSYHDQLFLGLEGGVRIARDKLLLVLNIHRLHNLDNGNDAVDHPANVETGLYTSFQEFSAFQLKLLAEDVYKGFGLMASMGGSLPGSLATTSVPASPALTVGVTRKW